jgi:hypothetical protein
LFAVEFLPNGLPYAWDDDGEPAPREALVERLMLEFLLMVLLRVTELPFRVVVTLRVMLVLRLIAVFRLANGI